MAIDKPFREYLFEYDHGGASWCITILAASTEDARARMSRMSLARYCGETVARIPVAPGWVGRLWERFVTRKQRSTPERGQSDADGGERE